MNSWVVALSSSIVTLASFSSVVSSFSSGSRGSTSKPVKDRVESPPESTPKHSRQHARQARPGRTPRLHLTRREPHPSLGAAHWIRITVSKSQGYTVLELCYLLLHTPGQAINNKPQPPHPPDAIPSRELLLIGPGSTVIKTDRI